jgi:hypothetical protein
MMYWLTDSGAAPTGTLAGEDSIGFDASNLAVVDVGGRWKVAEGAHWMLDFGPGHGNAVAALHFIRKHGFNEMCFVGRPVPSMTYFKRRRRLADHIRVLDTRVLHAAIDPPRWWQAQRELVATKEVVIDLSAQAVGDCDDPLAKAGISVVTTNDRPFKARIVEQYGIRGLALSGKTQLRLPSAVDQIDILAAHFGRPPTIKARGSDKKVIRVVADDRPRQVELMRLIGRGIESVEIDAPDGVLLVQLAVPGHVHGPQTAASDRTGNRRKKPSTKK